MRNKLFKTACESLLTFGPATLGIWFMVHVSKQLEEELSSSRALVDNKIAQELEQQHKVSQATLQKALDIEASTHKTTEADQRADHIWGLYQQNSTFFDRAQTLENMKKIQFEDEYQHFKDKEFYQIPIRARGR